jgi:hypothetical protein
VDSPDMWNPRNLGLESKTSVLVTVSDDQVIKICVLDMLGNLICFRLYQNT